eukprot:TRINITY_DN3462_c0_g2_i1.p1 TRINITY_DN3462_c0_g2~~TRINITY_DN3462_c0_g2_i1.p1  ORF type:complete len:167 (+),score=50.74 TRINITY_DN3462_c0_g2_i1:65-565(+)
MCIRDSFQPGRVKDDKIYLGWANLEFKDPNISETFIRTFRHKFIDEKGISYDVQVEKALNQETAINPSEFTYGTIKLEEMEEFKAYQESKKEGAKVVFDPSKPIPNENSKTEEGDTILVKELKAKWENERRKKKAKKDAQRNEKREKKKKEKQQVYVQKTVYVKKA